MTNVVSISMMDAAGMKDERVEAWGVTGRLAKSVNSDDLTRL